MSLRNGLLSAGLLIAGSGAAAAQSTQSFDVVATIPQVCAMEEPALAGGGLVNFRGLNGTTLQVVEGKRSG